MSEKPTTAPCREACPAGVDVPRYLRLIAAGRYVDALAVIRQSIPLPAVCGYVCPAPCELQCQLARIADAPEAIRMLKRFVADWPQPQGPSRRPAPPTGKSVAVVGSGPAGLTAAYHLAMQGHRVTVFEALPQAGGMMRVGIPSYRLPRSVLDAEIENIRQAGVAIETSTRIEAPGRLLAGGHDAVFVAIGAHRGARLGVEGDGLPAVVDALTFLRRVHLGESVAPGSSVVVVGGGNSAVDAARTALRLGAADATIVYRRSREEMRAYPAEVAEAIREGVKILFRATPSRIREAEGGLLRIECLRTTPAGSDRAAPPRPVAGSEFTLEAEALIAAVGQEPEIPPEFSLQLAGGTIRVTGEELATPTAGIFAGADCVTGPRSVIDAIVAGRRAAASIHRHLGGRDFADEPPVPFETAARPAVTIYPPPTAIAAEMPFVPVTERLGGFLPVELPLGAKAAEREAGRCLRCDLPIVAEPGLCRSCYICQLVCSLHFEAAFAPSKAAITIGQEPGPESPVRIAFTERCDGCGLCVRYCPYGALQRATANHDDAGCGSAPAFAGTTSSPA